MEIDAFDGSRKITALTTYPLVHHPDEKAVRKELIARGNKYLSLIGTPACREYTLTSAVMEVSLPSGESKIQKFNVCALHASTT
jgi:hypothetical protein